MPPIISIVGEKNIGKTYILIKIIKELKKRKYKVGVIKHTGDNFEIDKEGKDSFKISSAGADSVVISSPKKIAIVSSIKQEYSLEEICFLFDNLDVIFTEGYKKENKPKIEILENSSPKNKPLLAIISNEKIETKAPCFKKNQIKEMVDLIEEKYLKNKKSTQKNKTRLLVNKKEIFLNHFVENIINRTIIGMLSSLKGIKNIKEIKINLRR